MQESLIATGGVLVADFVFNTSGRFFRKLTANALGKVLFAMFVDSGNFSPLPWLLTVT